MLFYVTFFVFSGYYVDPVFVGNGVRRNMGPASVQKVMTVVAKEGFVSSSVRMFQQNVTVFPLMGYAFRMTIVEISMCPPKYYFDAF